MVVKGKVAKCKINYTIYNLFSLEKSTDYKTLFLPLSRSGTYQPWI